VSFRIVAAVIVALGLGAACGSSRSANAPSAARVKVVAGFFPVAAAAAAVGGDCVSVTNLTPAGAEPHDLELTSKDVDRIEDARVVFVMGNGFQPAVEKAAAQYASSHTVKLLAALPTDRAPSKVLDPHVWLDPQLYSKVVDVVTARLVAVAPECRDAMQRNAAAYQAEIARVDDAYRSGLADCARLTIVTSHEAFGYLARRYGLTQEGVAGVAPDEEPNAQRLAELADLVQREHITTILTEELVSRRVADALAREAGGVKTETLNPLEGLTADEVKQGANWASVMRDNLAKLRSALGCP
jgi:zinc transport system substrate-binding protein